MWKEQWPLRRLSLWLRSWDCRASWRDYKSLEVLVHVKQKVTRIRKATHQVSNAGNGEGWWNVQREDLRKTQDRSNTAAVAMITKKWNNVYHCYIVLVWTLSQMIYTVPIAKWPNKPFRANARARYYILIEDTLSLAICGAFASILLWALPLLNVPVSCRRPSKLSPAPRTVWLGRRTGLFPLMPE